MVSSKKVLILGSGFVTKPCVSILSESGYPVTVACRTLSSAKRLAAGIENAVPLSLDAANSEALDAQVAQHDVVVSLIPYVYHAAVIKSAIKFKKDVVTTSYVSPAMRELHDEAVAAGIVVMNEIGLDPGIDHLYAIKTIEEVHASGGKITGFLSYCGGLPEPSASANPLGYKFSWSAKGVLMALQNDGKYLENGSTATIAGTDLMSSAKDYWTGYPGYAFVAYPNRDSTPFRESYNIPEVQNLTRGTLRYKGFPDFVKVLVAAGYLSSAKIDALSQPITWREASQKILGSKSADAAGLEAAISSKMSFGEGETKNQVLAGISWLGLFSDNKITPRGTPVDTLCATLEQKMQYEHGEKDMVFLQHKFEIEHANGTREIRTSTLIEYGNPDGYMAMEKLVGVPCGVATKMLLEGSLTSEKGILAPYNEKLCAVLRKELSDKYGIGMIERTVV